MYWLAWLAGVLFVLQQAGPRAALLAWPSAALVQSWIPAKAVYFAGNSPGWSLSCEALFYALFPLLIVPIRRLSTRGLWMALGLAVLAVIAVPVALHPQQPDGLAYWGAYVFPATRLFEFVAGILTAQLVRTGRWFPFPFWLALTLAAAAVVGANALPRYLQFAAATIIPFVLLIAVAAQRDAWGSPTVFARRGMVKAGEWSYAFYLTHLLVLQMVMILNRRFVHLPSPVSGVVVLLVATATAAVLCEYVEKPLERRLRADRRLPASLTV